MLEIHRLAEQADYSQFQETALEIIKNTLGFDKAWWGLVSGLEVHSAYRYNLPEGYRRNWNNIKDSDPIAVQALAKPFEAVCFNSDDLADSSEICDFLGGYGIMHVLCVVAKQTGLDHFAFLSLYRSEQEFDENDRLLCEAIMPHLVDAHHRSWQRHLASERRSIGQRLSFSAICDEKGLILSADANLHGFVSLEWPRWNGATLPSEILDALMNSRDYKGRKLQSVGQKARGVWLVEFSELDPIHDLTKREAEVAHHFAAGMDYKSVARALDLSPSTVRHYLRIVYSKLHIKNKTELVRILGF